MTKLICLVLAINIIFIVDNVVCRYNDENLTLSHDEDAKEPHVRSFPYTNDEPDNSNVDISPKYQVALHNGTHDFCSGTIISDKHILTSAQCLYRTDGSIMRPLYVLIGTDQFVSPRKAAAMVENIYIPASFNETTSAIPIGDLAVLKLDRKFDTSLSIKKVNLPNDLYDDLSDTYESEEVMIYGYGIEKSTTRTPTKTLLVGRAKITPQEDCALAWKEYSTIHSNQICAAMLDNTYNASCVDAGGSGMIYERTIIGVMTFGNVFCNSTEAGGGRPVVYTRVTSWVSFLKNAIADNTDFKDMRIFTFIQAPVISSALSVVHYQSLLLWKTLMIINVIMLD